ncbi:MAG: type II secretion system F family protein [Lachnospiraceae bacterium]|nr:type II secretion system F family protein [Lachnospiraceae bacterium]
MKEFCRKIAEKLYQWLSSKGGGTYRFLHNVQVYQDMKLLEPTVTNPKKHKEYVIEKLTLCVMIMLVGFILTLLFMMQEANEKRVEDNALYRNQYGAGSKSVELIAHTADEEITLTVELGEREYTEEELLAMEEDFYKALIEQFLGENESPDLVCYDLNLVTAVDGYPFQISWQMEPNEYMDETGHLLMDTVEKPIVMELMANVSCGEYQSCYPFAVCIGNRAVPISMEEKLTKELLQTEEASRKEDFLLLPAEYQKEAINWEYPGGGTGILFLILTPLTAVLIYFGKDKDLHQKVEERDEQLRMDYPELVSKLALLIGAGMTVTNAWNRITADYRRKREKTGIKRFAYEEMLITTYELESGASQKDALEHFGKRCRAPCYIKLATLLSQNLRKGSTNVFDLLQEEATFALEDRKKLAKKKGEQAGTKLLFPMMLLLGIVMILMIVPAFSDFL